MVVVHKKNVYPGEHEAIIEESVWNQVQEIFKKHEKSGQKVRKTMTPSFLKGLCSLRFLQCADASNLLK